MPVKVLQICQLGYKEVLKEASFTWRQGESIALMGANGSGKSTLAKLIVGLLKPTKGKICFYEGAEAGFAGCEADQKVSEKAGRKGWERLEQWKEVAYIGQHPRRQTVGATVSEELSFGLLNLGLEMPEVKKQVRELLKAIGLGGKENTSPAHLSGGERQRLVTAAVLAMQPAFLILDEALSMLDSNAQARIVSVLQNTKSLMGRLWITHDPEIAANADRLLLLKHGVLYEMDEPAKALASNDIRVEYGIRGSNLDLASSVFRQEDVRSGENFIEMLKWQNVNLNNRLKLDKKVAKGEFIGIIGPSGAGKTTLLESAASLIKARQGQVWVHGELVKTTGPGGTKKGVRLLLQEAGEYLIGRSVFKEVFYEPFTLKSLGKKLVIIKGKPGTEENATQEMTERVDYLRKMGIPAEMFNHTPEQLSGGERQKVALAAVLQTSPKILLLDEPMLGLDACGRQIVNRFISGLGHAITVLFVTHDLQDVLPFATRLWLVRAGEVILDCPAGEWGKHVAEFQEAGVRC